MNCAENLLEPTTLLRLAEDWKKDMDSKWQYVGAVLMDLSKSFDCLAHDHILTKPIAYGLSFDACDFSNRKQMVKVGQFCSSWLNIIKGCPKAISLDPFYLIFL